MCKPAKKQVCYRHLMKCSYSMLHKKGVLFSPMMQIFFAYMRKAFSTPVLFMLPNKKRLAVIFAF